MKRKKIRKDTNGSSSRNKISMPVDKKNIWKRKKDCNNDAVLILCEHCGNSWLMKNKLVSDNFECSLELLSQINRND